MLISRYVIASLPPLLLVTAIGFLRLPWSRSGAVGLGALAFAALIGLFAYNLRPRDDLRGIAGWLAANLRPGDCLVTIPEALIGLQYYYREPIPCFTTFRAISSIKSLGTPTRILALETLSTDLTGLDRLGTEIIRHRFGPSTLIELQPK